MGAPGWAESPNLAAPSAVASAGPWHRATTPAEVMTADRGAARG